MRRLNGTAHSALRQHLKAGGMIAYPTESCYGLGCLSTHAGAIRRVIRLKKRPAHKGLIVIGAHFAQFSHLLQKLPAQEIDALTQAWQRACTTFLLPAGKRALPLLRGARHRHIGVRIPTHDGAQNLCRDLGVALVSTSANRAHRRPCKSYREARRQFGAQAVVLRGQIGKRARPSTIIDWVSGQVLR